MRFEIPDDKKHVFDMVIQVRWGDMDALQHVNNTVYFRYLEMVRVAWLREYGAFQPHSEEGPVVVNAFCNFMRQVSYPCDLLARLYVANPGRSSFDTFTTLALSTEPDSVYAAGGATVVWSHYAQQRSVPLPDWVREVLRPDPAPGAP